MAERGFWHRRAAMTRGLAGLLIVFLLAVACLSGCAGQRLEVRPRGDVVFGVGAGSR